MVQCQLRNKRLFRSLWLETRVAHSPDNTGAVSPVACLLFGLNPASQNSVFSQLPPGGQNTDCTSPATLLWRMKNKIMTQFLNNQWMHDSFLGLVAYIDFTLENVTAWSSVLKECWIYQPSFCFIYECICVCVWPAQVTVQVWRSENPFAS